MKNSTNVIITVKYKLVLSVADTHFWDSETGTYGDLFATNDNKVKIYKASKDCYSCKELETQNTEQSGRVKPSKLKLCNELLSVSKEI